MINKLRYFLLKIYWFLFRPKTLGVKCVIQNGNEFVMIKNTYGGLKKWLFPGGGVHKNESPEMAVEREIFEELGIKIFGLEKIGEYKSNKEYKKDNIIVFKAISKTKQLKTDNKEIAEAQWFKRENLPQITGYSKLILSMMYN